MFKRYGARASGEIGLKSRKATKTGTCACAGKTLATGVRVR